MLYLAVEEAPSAESVEEEIRRRHYANFDESFFHYCDQELKKINTFYSGEKEHGEGICSKLSYLTNDVVDGAIDG